MNLWGAPRWRVEEGELYIEPASPLADWLRAPPNPQLDRLIDELRLQPNPGRLRLWGKEDLDELQEWLPGRKRWQELAPAIRHLNIFAPPSWQPALAQQDLEQLQKVSQPDGRGWQTATREKAPIDIHRPLRGLRALISWHEGGWQLLLLDQAGQPQLSHGKSESELLEVLRTAGKPPRHQLAPDEWIVRAGPRPRLLLPRLNPLRRDCQVLGSGGHRSAPKAVFTRPAMLLGQDLQVRRCRRQSWQELQQRHLSGGLALEALEPLEIREDSGLRLLAVYRPDNPYLG